MAGTTANASAVQGAGGEWLLDPYNLTISATVTNTTNLAGPPYSFSSGTAGSNVLNTDIQNQLNAGTSVTLQTTGTALDGMGAGGINVNANIAKTAGGVATLLLKAHNDIIVAGNVAISSTAGALNVTLNSDSDASGAGGIRLNTGSSIVSNGGNIIMGGGVDPLTGYAIGTAGALNSGIHVLGNITAGTGNVTLHGQSALGNGITFAGGTLSSDGVITVNGETSKAGIGANIPANFMAGVRFENVGTRLTTATGTVTITGLSNGGLESQGVTVDAATIETTGSGSLTLNGTATVLGNSGWGIGINSGGVVRSLAVGGGALNFMAASPDWGNVLFNGSISSNGGAVNLTDSSNNGIYLAGTGGD